MASEVSPIEAGDAVALASATLPQVSKKELTGPQPVTPVEGEQEFADQQQQLLQQQQDEEAKRAAAINESIAEQFQTAFDQTEDILLSVLDPIPLPPEQQIVLSSEGRTRKVILFGNLTLDVFI